MKVESPKLLAEYIDHTCLRPEAKEADILRVCDEALEFHFKTVCVESKWLSLVGSRLSGSKVIPITVISFPHGNDPTDNKIADVKRALANGAQEIDMVLNRQLLAAKDFLNCYRDLALVVQAAQPKSVKVILETSELTRDEKVIASALVKAAGAVFVKTSTGFSKSGATEEDVRLIRSVVGPEMGVKASGGIRDTATAIRMIEAGATRLGTSASVDIVKGLSNTSSESVGSY